MFRGGGGGSSNICSAGVVALSRHCERVVHGHTEKEFPCTPKKERRGMGKHGGGGGGSVYFFRETKEERGPSLTQFHSILALPRSATFLQLFSPRSPPRPPTNHWRPRSNQTPTANSRIFFAEIGWVSLLTDGGNEVPIVLRRWLVPGKGVLMGCDVCV